MSLSRREFLRLSGVVAAELVLVPLETIAAALNSPKPPNNELATLLDGIKEDTAIKFINQTRPQISSKNIITGDWHWLTTDQQVEELKRNRPELGKLEEGNFYGITFMDDSARPTYINLPEINKMVNSEGG